MGLRRNLLDQWWRSVTTSSDQVFGIKTLNRSKNPPLGGAGQLGIVDLDNVAQVLGRKEVGREELIQQVRELLQRSPLMRTSLFQGKARPHLKGFQRLHILTLVTATVCPLTNPTELTQQWDSFPGALEQFVPSLELVNRRLPFGLAETGLCLQPPGSSGW